MIVIEVKKTGSSRDPAISIVTFAKSEEEIGPKSIRAISSTMSTPAGSLSFVEDRSGEYDDAETGYIGQILDSRPGQYSYNVFAWPEDKIDEVVISGMFVNVYTTEALKRERPHKVKIFNSFDNSQREIDFPSFYSASMYAEEYDANAASMSESLIIENEYGETIKTYK